MIANRPTPHGRPAPVAVRCAYALLPAVLFAGSLVLTPPAAAQSLDELLDLEPDKPATTEPSDDADDGRAGDGEAPDDDEALARKLAEMRAKAAEDFKAAANALEEAVEEMNDVSKRLSEAHDPSLETQRAQKQIIQKIDQMIAAAKQQQQQSSSSSSSSQQQREQDAGASRMQGQSQGQSNQPQGNQGHRGGASPGSVTATGDTQKPIEELKQEWGQLPPRLRDELTEGLGERFSPVYRLMTEAYYRRLDEEAGE